MKIMLRLLCLMLVAGWSVANEIGVGILITPQQRAAYETLFKNFTRETGIRVTSYARSDEEFKKDLRGWLTGSGGPDVLYWQASQRLYALADQGLIRPITHLWEAQRLDQNFSHVKSGVSYKGEIYGLPFSYYHWGIYYRKSVIAAAGGVPSNWDAFIRQCQQLKAQGITPIAIGTASHWPAAAWFDYLNLRINGIEFHQQLLDGTVSFHHERVKEVFMQWKRLVDGGFFTENSGNYDWDEVLPFFYRGYSAYTLIGNFVASKFSQELAQDVGFMPFPRVNDTPPYEEAPMDVFMIAANSRNPENAEVFIKYMARAEVQSAHTKNLGYLPPNKSATVGDDPFVLAGSRLLNRAEDVSQYFDRDTLPAFEKLAVPVLARFVASGDIKATLDALEAARLEVFWQDTQGVQ